MQFGARRKYSLSSRSACNSTGLLSSAATSTQVSGGIMLDGARLSPWRKRHRRRVPARHPGSALRCDYDVVMHPSDPVGFLGDSFGSFTGFLCGDSAAEPDDAITIRIDLHIG